MTNSATEYENVAGNHYDKYHTANPIAQFLMNGFLSAFDELTEQTKQKDVFEVGCGEGHLSMRLLRRGLSVAGCDLEESVVAQANAQSSDAGFGAPFFAESIYNLNSKKHAANLVVCCEVLEHLPNPEDALKILAQLCRSHVLLSVPREPIWRAMNLARGKYVQQLGNTPGHIQHWSTRRFTEMIARHFDIVEIRTPLPWTMLLGTKRAS